jgi:hypothetical protein
MSEARLIARLRFALFAWVLNRYVFSLNCMAGPAKMICFAARGGLSQSSNEYRMPDQNLMDTNEIDKV